MFDRVDAIVIKLAGVAYLQDKDRDVFEMFDAILQRSRHETKFP